MTDPALRGGLWQSRISYHLSGCWLHLCLNNHRLPRGHGLRLLVERGRGLEGKDCQEEGEDDADEVARDDGPDSPKKVVLDVLAQSILRIHAPVRAQAALSTTGVSRGLFSLASCAPHDSQDT